MSIWDDTRADWGATRTSGMAFVAANRRTEFFNHYNGADPLNLADKPHSACLAKVKADQTFHRGPQRGWSDIGYNGLICQHGRAIEGRGLDWAGAHCPDHNTSGYGIQFQVGGNEAPTQAAKNRMRRLYDDLSDRSGRRLAMKGHRDGLATLCPGDVVYAWVKAGMPTTSIGSSNTPTPQKDEIDMASLKDLGTTVTNAIRDHWSEEVTIPGEPKKRTRNQIFIWGYARAGAAARDAQKALAVSRLAAERSGVAVSEIRAVEAKVDELLDGQES